MPVYMGEDEVIKRNMALAEEKHYTVDDIKSLPEDIRAELIDGQLFYMATPTTTHQSIVMHISGTIWNYIKSNEGKCQVYQAPLAVYSPEDDKTYLEPDVVVVCDLDKIEKDGCHGAPDLVVEVVSPSTRGRDYLLKLNKYQKMGVREYWIVDYERMIVHVYRFEQEIYSEAVNIYDFTNEIPVGIFEDLTINLSEFT